MIARINGIDHIGIAAADMQKNDSCYRKLGFNLTKPYPLLALDSENNLTELGQHSHHFIFDRSYVELTGIVDPSKGSHIGPFLDKFEGLHILCFNTDNAELAASQIQQMGLEVGKIQIASRHVNYGRKGIARFKWFTIAQRYAPEGLICIVEHLTPEVVFQENMMSHDNFSTSLQEVTICTKEVNQCCQNYSNILSLDPKPHSLGYKFELSSNNLIVLDNDSYKTRYPSERPPAVPCLASFAIAVSDITKTKEFLNNRYIELNYRNPNNFWVPSKSAGGTIIEFCGSEQI